MKEGHTKKSAIYLSAGLSPPFPLPSPARTITISVSNDTSANSDIHRVLVELNFDTLGQEGVNQERSIQLAAESSYYLVCTQEDESFSGSGVVWSRDGSLFTITSTERIYATRRNSRTWELVITNFLASDAGRFSCAGSSETLTLDISTGE